MNGNLFANMNDNKVTNLSNINIRDLNYLPPNKTYTSVCTSVHAWVSTVYNYDTKNITRMVLVR
jgi:hypothetical protein